MVCLCSLAIITVLLFSLLVGCFQVQLHWIPAMFCLHAVKCNCMGLCILQLLQSFCFLHRWVVFRCSHMGVLPCFTSVQLHRALCLPFITVILFSSRWDVFWCSCTGSLHCCFPCTVAWGVASCNFYNLIIFYTCGMMLSSSSFFKALNFF